MPGTLKAREETTPNSRAAQNSPEGANAAAQEAGGRVSPIP